MAFNTPLRWGLVFLSCPISLSDEQRVELMRLAGLAYFADEHLITFDWGSLRGEVRAISETVLLGSFYGQRFQAEVHRPEGSATLEFLVTEAQLQSAGNQPIAEA